MYQSIIGDKNLYSFTPVANDVDKYAVSYDDISKYLPYDTTNSNNSAPPTPTTNLPIANDSEVDEVLNGVFG